MPEDLTPRQRARFEGLVASGYLPTLEEMAKSLTAPFWWHDSRRPPGDQFLKGGTICFVDTGKRLLGVTAAHVHTGGMAALKGSPYIGCQIGGHSFDPERSLLAIDEQLDLAVYSLSEIQVSAALAHIHHAPVWPPKVDDNDAHIVGGWLWSLKEEGEGETTHSFLHVIARLSSHSETKLGIVIAMSTSVAWGRNDLPRGTNLGGMSGGPVYRVSETGLFQLTLVGIVYEFQPSFGITLARPLSLIDDLGRII